jgi:leucyl/phenylalanyl-tRNA--protein transferase
MFARVSDASKVALAYLVAFLRRHGVRMVDCQQETGHLASLGAAPIPRSRFLEHLRAAIAEPPIRDWTVASPFAASAASAESAAAPDKSGNSPAIPLDG